MQKNIFTRFYKIRKVFFIFINPISYTNFRARVPLSEYKGVILQLTTEEKNKIAELMSEKSALLLQLTSIEKKLNKEKTIIGSTGLFQIFGKIDFRIREIEDTIKQIKIDRRNQQIKELEYLDLMM